MLPVRHVLFVTSGRELQCGLSLLRDAGHLSFFEFMVGVILNARLCDCPLTLEDVEPVVDACDGLIRMEAQDMTPPLS